jgi:hypothetical protein
MSELAGIKDGRGLDKSFAQISARRRENPRPSRAWTGHPGTDKLGELMLKIDRPSGQLSKLGSLLMIDAEMKERSDLQRLIFRNSEEFFQKECGEDLFVLNEEVMPSDLVGDRIDLLAVDSEGATVIIELKRGSDKLQLLQALAYASMISSLTWKEIRAKTDPTRSEALSTFLSENDLGEENEDGEVKLNNSQRIVLIAESYDYEVLCTAQWLTDKWGLNITCYEVALARDGLNNSEYLSAVQLLPAKPLAEQARLRGALRSQAANEPKPIEKRLNECSNETIRNFFREILLQNPRKNRRGTSILFPPQGKMRFRVTPRKQYARVVQSGRFEGDEEDWKTLSSSSLRAVRSGQNLVFHLSNATDVAVFRKFVTTDLPKIKWLNGRPDADDEDDENED